MKIRIKNILFFMIQIEYVTCCNVLKNIESQPSQYKTNYDANI